MDNKLIGLNIISDRILRSWIRCRRKAWLDKYGDSSKRVWTAHRTLQLDHQYRCFEKLIKGKPQRGIHACQKGAKNIVGLRLKGKLNSEQFIEGHPPLLQRMEGQSKWGNFYYAPILARQGKKVTREILLSLALYGFLLEKTQLSPVKRGLIVSKTKSNIGIEKINLKGRIHNQLIDVLNKMNSELSQAEPPPLTTDRRKCSLCSWRNICNLEAAEKGLLSEVSGIGSKREAILKEIGVNRINDLAEANPDQLQTRLKKFGVQHVEVTHELIAQARSQRGGYYERLEDGPALSEIKNAPGILIYDIESDPDDRDDFLHGFLTLKRSNNGSWDVKNTKYHPLLMLSKDGEAFAWRRIKRKLNLYQNWPILHYGETEPLTITRMANRQGVKKEEIDILNTRFIDIHSKIRKYWRLPLNSYGLKAVAGSLGFKWRQEKADGAQALLWWRQWKESVKTGKGRKNTLKLIFNYNEDDCLATLKASKWMLLQDKNNISIGQLK